MIVRFWGVRGTIPSPGPDTMKYGANTACISVHTTDQQTIILDAGTGIRRLGNFLVDTYPARIVATILISHTHWDHIQGFPFFAPLLDRDNRFVVIGQKRMGQQLEKVLAGQISEPYLPFAYKELAADIHVKEIVSREVMVIGDSTSVSAGELNHPGGCLGYRVRNEDNVFVYCTDTSHNDDELLPSVLELAQDADLLVHEASFSLEERNKYPHWGHSSWLEAAQVAAAANVGYLALFHYSPNSSDDHMEGILEKARAIFPRTILAREGMGVKLPIKDGQLTTFLE